MAALLTYCDSGAQDFEQQRLLYLSLAILGCLSLPLSVFPSIIVNALFSVYYIISTARGIASALKQIRNSNTYDEITYYRKLTL